VHPFGLLREIIGNAGCAAKLLPDGLGFEKHATVTSFALTVIREIVTKPASKD
jgi:hypothetical protein